MSSSCAPKVGPDPRLGSPALVRPWSNAARVGLWVPALLFVVLASVGLPLIQDEAYYWTWSRDLAWHYFDHPPLVAWVLAATRGLLGDSPAALRLPSVLSMVASVCLSVAATRPLTAEREQVRAELLAVLLLVGSPMFLVGLIPATPDPYLVLGAATAAYLITRALASRSPADLFFAAMVTTLLVGIKHYGAFLSLGALFVLLAYRDGRVVLRRPPVVGGVAAGVLLLSPWLWAEWSASGASSVAFQWSRVIGGQSRWSGLISVPITLGSLLGSLGPVATLGVFHFGARSFVETKPLTDRVLAGGALMLVAACFVAVWLGSGEANWPIPALVFVVPSLAAAIATRVRWTRAAVAVGVIFHVVLLAFLIHMAHPFLPLSLRRDPSARAAGWAPIAALAEQRMRAHEGDLIAAERYQNASLVRYHLGDRWPVWEVGSAGHRRSQYDLWARPRACPGDVIVTVSRKREGLTAVRGVELEPPTVIVRKRSGLSGRETWYVGVTRLTDGMNERTCPKKAP